MPNSKKKYSAIDTQNLVDWFKNTRLGQIITIAVPVAGVTAAIMIWGYQQLIEHRSLKITDLTQKIEQLEQELRQRDSQIKSFEEEKRKLQNQLYQRDSTIKTISDELENIKRQSLRVKNPLTHSKSEPINKKQHDITEPTENQYSIVVINVNPNRVGADVLVNDTLKCNAPCSLRVRNGPNKLKVVYEDKSTGYKWQYEKSINVSGSITLSLKNNDFMKTK